jgi:hypothetical protein
MGFKSHIWKKTPGPRSPGSRVDPPGWPCLARSLHQSVFWQTWTDPAPGSWVDPPGQAGFNNYGLNSFSSYNIYKNALGLSINNKKRKRSTSFDISHQTKAKTFLVLSTLLTPIFFFFSRIVLTFSQNQMVCRSLQKLMLFFKPKVTGLDEECIREKFFFSYWNHYMQDKSYPN